jgi:hypothetical protein
MKPRTLCACHCVAVIMAPRVAPEGWRNKLRIFSVLVPSPPTRPCFDCLAATAATTAGLRRLGSSEPLDFNETASSGLNAPHNDYTGSEVCLRWPGA